MVDSASLQYDRSNRVVRVSVDFYLAHLCPHFVCFIYIYINIIIDNDDFFILLVIIKARVFLPLKGYFFYPFEALILLLHWFKRGASNLREEGMKKT